MGHVSVGHILAGHKSVGHILKGHTLVGHILVCHILLGHILVGLTVICKALVEPCFLAPHSRSRARTN